MSTILDMIGSFIIGGLLMLMILRVNSNFNQMSTEDRMELVVQENLTELVAEIEFDFRKIGYGVGNPALAITAMDTSAISFRADLDNNGSIDVVTYRLATSPDVTGTANPNDRTLRRSVNGQTIISSLGVVDFQMTMFDASGAQTTNPANVKTIEYNLVVESPFPVDTTYARSVWTGTIQPKNL